MTQRKYKLYVSAEEKLHDMALGCQQGQKELFVPVGCLKLGGEFFG
jgi:hypothetical protein